LNDGEKSEKYEKTIESENNSENTQKQHIEKFKHHKPCSSASSQHAGCERKYQFGGRVMQMALKEALSCNETGIQSIQTTKRNETNEIRH
jgi:hypothetical protein